MHAVYITRRHLRDDCSGSLDEERAQDRAPDRSDRLLAALGLTDSADACPSRPPAGAIEPSRPARFRRQAARGSGMATVAFSRLVPASAIKDRGGFAHLRRHLASTAGENPRLETHLSSDGNATDPAPADRG